MATLEEFNAFLEANASRIYVRAELDGRWQSASLKDLDQRSADQAAAYRELFRRRFADNPDYRPCMVLGD